MIKYFEDNVVLTSQTPEAYLVMEYETGDSAGIVDPSTNLDSVDLYINGWDATTLYPSYMDPSLLDASAGVEFGPGKNAVFHLFTDSIEDFDYDLKLSYKYFGPGPTGFASWTHSIGWTPSPTFFGTPPINISPSGVGGFGDWIQSNSFSVTGGDRLDVSVLYSHQSGPTDPNMTFTIWEDPGVIIHNFLPSTSTGSEWIDASIILDPLTTSVKFIFDTLSGAGNYQFGATNWKVETVGDQNIIYDVSVYNRPFLLDTTEFNTFENVSPLVDNEASYLLLRTNPKYSGNVKLMIDVSENMYLDTFKVSDILSNKKYRRQAVSGNSFLSGDIRRVFSSLPAGEIFKVAATDTLNISNPKTEYFDQYNTRYSYGARILVDELYPEEYSMLAPLWINNKLPDHFAIFRLPGNFNEETYDGEPLDELAYKFITNGELIESWNMKSNVPLGNYLYNHLSELLKVESPVNLSLNEYDPNTWNGMTVDKGIIAGRSEVPYFFNKTAHNFTDLNAFVSQGFERNNLLCPNLLNLEFAFNDPDVSLYTMQRYFGLYLTENELYEFAYYSDEPDSSVNIISLDGRDVLSFANSSVFDSFGMVDETYENRLFVLNDGKELERICCVAQFDGTREYVEEYVNKLGKNIFNTLVLKKDINKFITLKINNLLVQGEHLRVINKTQNKIWEVYGTETETLDPGTAGPYVSHNEPSSGYPDVYRTSFSVMGDISDQAEAIRQAFTMFADYDEAPFVIGFSKVDGLSLIINDEDNDDEYLFQRLTAQIAYSIGDPTSEFNLAAGPEDISFFGVLIPDASDFSRMAFDTSYGPIDFELYGDRLSIILDMINTDQSNVYSFDSSTREFFTENVLYESVDGWNQLIQEFDVSAGIVHQFQWVDDPTSQYNNSIIITEKEIALNEDNIWWAYDVYPLYVSLMGINAVKDMDFTVYDSSTDSMDFKSTYWGAHNGDYLTYRESLAPGEELTFTGRGSYTITQGQGFIDISTYTKSFTSFESSPTTAAHFNTFFGEATVRATSTTYILFNVLDGSHNYTSYDAGITEELLYDYYSDNFYLDSSDNQIKDKKSLKYGLTIPTVTKWGTTGQDVRSNNVRLNLTGDFFTDGSTITNSNFIPYSDSSLYADEVSYPVFKYSSYSGNDEWKEYVYYDINDIVEDGSSRTSVRDLIFDEPHVDIFSKMLYNNNGISGNATRSSILYYNLYQNQVITTLKGLKFGLSVTSTGEKNLNVTNWDRYRFSMISSPSRNIKSNYPMEVIINENTETILMIWYQGNDVLNYTYKWSTFLPGKGVLVDEWGTPVNKEYHSFLTDENEPGYSFIKSPFIVDTNNISTIAYKMYDTSSDYDSSVCAPFNQFSYDTIDRINSVFNAYSTVLGDNEVVGNLFTFSGKSFDSFNQQYLDYNYGPASNSFGPNISNIASNYINNYNFYRENTCNFETFQYIINTNNIGYYVIQEDILLSSDNFSNQPIEINLYSPIEYKAPNADSSIYSYNGSYVPIFNNILVFQDNEDSEFINTVEKDFVFANTDLRSYENIYQFWFNRVVETVTDGDSSNNILYEEDYNPFKSQWDSNYYTLSSGITNTLVNGYESSLELPAFFGSKLISLPPELELDEWNASNSKVIEGVDFYQLEYNLTKSIVDLFTNNLTFIENWGDLPTVSDEIINRYIIKTILSYYNISIDKINPTVYDKEFDGEILYKEYDSGFTNELVNLDSQLSFINNEYTYKIKFDKTDNRSYFAKFKFNKV